MDDYTRKQNRLHDERIAAEIECWCPEAKSGRDFRVVGRSRKDVDSYSYTAIVVNKNSPHRDELVDAALDRLAAYDCGPGRSFGSHPTTRESATRIMVKQCCGLDI